ncbi:hypothetical protein MAUB1S_00934 [Mycolicibacterium aubagnense]
MWVVDIGPHILLNQRGERGLRQVPVAVDAGVDQQIHIVRVPSGPFQTRCGRSDGEA